MSPVEASPSLDMRTSALLRIVSAIETATTLDELLLLSLNEFTQLLEVSHGAIVMLKDDNVTTQLIGTYPPRVNLAPPVPLSETSFMQEIITTRQSIQIFDVQEVEENSPYIELLKEEPIHSILIVPMVSQDRVTGFLTLGDVGEPRTFTQNEVALARLLAGQLSAAITSFAVTDAAQRRSAELATLNDIAAAVTSSLDPREVYHVVVQKLNEYFRVDAGSLLMRDEVTGDLEFVMTLEAGEEKLVGVVVPRGEGVAGYVAEKQRYAIVLNPEEDPRFYRKISEKTGFPSRSILCVPMVVKGRTIGVIEMLNKREGEFTEEDANRLLRMATTIGVAIENARLFQQVATGRDRLEAILNSNTDGILMADNHGIVVTVNPKAAQILQKSQDEVLGCAIQDLLNELRQRALDVNTPPWLSDAINSSEIVELELGTQQYSFLRQLSLPVRDAQGTVMGQLVLLQDISQERELSQLRDDYTGMLIHDLRAPLTAIMNGITMVRRGLGGPISEQQNELLGIAYQSSQTMLEMVNTLLDISKMEQGRMNLTIEAFPIAPVIEETLDRLRAFAEAHRVTFRQEIPETLPMLEADREKMVRILQNLIDNAIKYSPNGGEVLLGTSTIAVNHRGKVESGKIDPRYFIPTPVMPPELDEGYWQVFWIADQGPGIPPQYHERIFEKFGQVRSRKVRGTGLGLTFCRLAVESHHGRIWVESVEGEGSTFALVLPMNSITPSP